MPPVLKVSGLRKNFGNIKALDGLDLTLEPGTVHGLVGPNGAGKTTMLSILVGLRRKTTGEIHFGMPSDRVMLLPDTPDFFTFLTAREVVDLARFPFREIVGEGSVEEVIHQVGLSDSIDRRVGGFSRGMKQRLGLAATVVSDPQLLLLDEPCSALDPLGRREVLDLVSTLKNKSTILLSTHILSDVESACDSVTVINRGRALYEGPVNGINREQGETFEDAVLNLLRSDSDMSGLGTMSGR